MLKPPQSLMIINGKFFTEMPEQPPHDVYIYMGAMKDDVYDKISVVYYDVALSDEAKAFAIPEKKVKNGKDILERSKSAQTFPVEITDGMPDIKPGDVFPEFELKDTKGRVWTRDDFEGRKVVVNFWYTGCKPCIYEMPELSRWVSRYPDVLFVAMTFQTAEQIERTVKERKFKFHQFVEARAVENAVGLGSYPLTLVLDEECRVVLVEAGTTPVQRQRIEKYLK
ncbi:MAG: TlpA family protein disulfide reductase [Bacteroidales bacterium]|nr:TlpA family protein disulfide reductase [Bacteroidales bacterium]